MRLILLALMPLSLVMFSGCTETAVEEPASESVTGGASPVAGSGSGTAGGSSSKSAAGGTGVAFAPADDSAEATVKAVIQEVSKGHPEVIWNAMPSHYQADVNTVVQTFGKNMDPQAWGQIMDVVGKLHNILDTKGEFITNSEHIKNLPNSEDIKDALPKMAGLLKSVLEMADLDRLATFDGATFMAGPGAQLLNQADLLAKLNPDSPSLVDLANAEVKTISSEGDNATLEVTGPNGETNESNWIRVNGRWVPEEMAQDWDTNMEAARTQLAELPETMKQAAPQIALFAGMANGALMQFSAAEDQEQFDLAIANTMGQFGSMMMMGAGGGGFGGPPPDFGGDSDFDSDGDEIDFDIETETDDRSSPDSE